MYGLIPVAPPASAPAPGLTLRYAFIMTSATSELRTLPREGQMNASSGAWVNSTLLDGTPFGYFTRGNDHSNSQGSSASEDPKIRGNIWILNNRVGNRISIGQLAPGTYQLDFAAGAAIGSDPTCVCQLDIYDGTNRQSASDALLLSLSRGAGDIGTTGLYWDGVDDTTFTSDQWLARDVATRSHTVTITDRNDPGGLEDTATGLGFDISFTSGTASINRLNWVRLWQ